MAKPPITDYDTKNYDYSEYWERENREYEHKAEIIALERMLNKIPQNKRKVFVDFGGGYGRLMPVYAQRFEHVILLDYSVSNLKKGVEAAEKANIKNISFVAANLYHLPFRAQSISVGAMIRVIHHIENTSLLFGELGRTVSGSLLIDCPNKRHFKAVVKGLFGGTLKNVLSHKPYKQPSRKDSEDTCGGKGIFLNYHPKHIEELAKVVGFEKIKRLSVSNFRSRTLKKVLPLGLLVALEKIAQPLMAPCLYGPQIWTLFEKTQASEIHSASNLEKHFVCPACVGSLAIGKHGATCQKCKKEWKLIDGKIWDFRYEG